MTGSSGFFDFATRAFGDDGPRGPQTVYRIAERIVRVLYADEAVAERLMPVLDHLDRAELLLDTEADLTIWAWDDASAGFETPEPLVEPNASGIIYHGGPFHFSYDISARRIEAYDAVRRFGLFRVPDTRRLSARDQAAPFLRIFHWWSLNNGRHLVHGAAVGTHDGAALIVGRSGSGKSTAALSCVGGTLQFLGDDSVLVEHGVHPRVHSLYSSGKADARSMSILPRLADGFSPVIGDEKSIIFLTQQFTSALLPSAPLRAVVIPRIDSAANCEISRASAETALRALAPSTILQMPGGHAASLARMAALVRVIPCWTLLIGRNTEAIAPALLEIIARSR